MWLARLERGLREGEGHGLREWLKDRSNRNAILEAANLWHGPEITAVLAALVPASSMIAKPTTKPRSLAVSLSAAGLVFMGVMAIILLSGHTPLSLFDGSRGKAPASTTENYATGIGETRVVTLSDGSTITLNTGTRVAVSYSPRSRDLYLTDGEAMFNAALQPDRPFSVVAGKRRFEAAGTRFNLRKLTPDNVELTVTEGMVKVLDAPPRLPDTPARRRDFITFGEATVRPFEAALVEPGFQSIIQLDARDVEARLAWQRGLIIVDDQALQDVIAEVERYTSTRFVVSDEKLRSVRVSGRFRTGDVNSVRRALNQNFLVSSRRDIRGRVVLTAALPPR